LQRSWLVPCDKLALPRQAYHLQHAKTQQSTHEGGYRIYNLERACALLRNGNNLHLHTSKGRPISASSPGGWWPLSWSSAGRQRLTAQAQAMKGGGDRGHRQGAKTRYQDNDLCRGDNNHRGPGMGLSPRTTNSLLATLFNLIQPEVILAALYGFPAGIGPDTAGHARRS
jgi:hypothetical protein